jgi:acyl transferase domain-containing protein
MDTVSNLSKSDILFLNDDSTKLSQAEYSQPICTALQIALVDLLASWGVAPHAVVGHSSGEIAAAYAAGSLTKKDAIIIAFYRGYVCKKPRKMGAMAAIGLGKADVLPFLLPGVGIACENSASSITLSGDSDTLDKVLASLKEKNPDAFARKLQVAMAYHSGMILFSFLPLHRITVVIVLTLPRPHAARRRQLSLPTLQAC